MKPRILVLGDAILDEYVYVRQIKRNPEGEGYVYQVNHTERFAGGAAGLAIVCQSLGADVYLYTHCGDDKDGEILFRLLWDGDLRGHKLKLWYKDYDYDTTTKCRLVDYETHLFLPNRFDSESPRDFDWDLATSDGLDVTSFDDFDAILISDYGKGAITDKLITMLPKGGVKIFVDPQYNRPWKEYGPVDLIKANRREWQAEIDRYQTYPPTLVVSLAESGISWTHDQLEWNGFPSKVSNLVDVTGAGDTVFATIGVILAAGGNISDACRLAMETAAEQVRHIGIRPLKPLTRSTSPDEWNQQT